MSKHINFSLTDTTWTFASTASKSCFSTRKDAVGLRLLYLKKENDMV